MWLKSPIGKAALLMALMGGPAFAADIIVDVAVETVVDGVVTARTEAECAAGTNLTCTATSVDGARFTHWSLSTDQSFEARDTFGRAYETVTVRILEATVLRANYMSPDVDSDNDWLSDGDELYWYGDLDEDALSDTDGDGVPLSVELAAGTNPHLVNAPASGRLLSAMTSVHLYNPHHYLPYVLRCEPEGELFAAESVYLPPGTNAVTPVGDWRTTTFAYWTLDGVPQRDAFGRALDAVTFEMPGDRSPELVAVCVSNETERAKLYWYGDTAVSLDSDTDGDGMSFANELWVGSNPLLAETDRTGVVLHDQTAKALYNPFGYAQYVIRSEPENALFPTVTKYVEPGTNVVTPVCSPDVGGFVYWTLDGAVQRDVFGRSLDSVSFAAKAGSTEAVAVCDTNEATSVLLYWYGRTDVPLDSDSDGDGATLAEELENGTNPLLAETERVGGVLHGMGANMKVDLQGFEQSAGLIVDGGYRSLFKSLTTAGESFGTENDRAVRPVVSDVTGDGLFDVVVIAGGATNVFVNVGALGSPVFAATNGVSLAGVDWAANDVAQLAGLSLDVAAPADALSCAFGDADQDGVADLLVSDSQGRIWFYKGTKATEGTQGTPTNYQLPATNYQLLHKVWGGTYAGFAQGLRIAVVDWDADGDLDCLCGTADGKLMLLIDPGAGRPTGLVADAGVDSVNLSWNASRQSRVRSYRVYRSLESLSSFESLANPDLPSYRDVPPEEGRYSYQVTSLSRHYVAGNSEPVVRESKPSEAVSVDFGTAQFLWRLAAEGEAVNAQLIVRNSSGLAGDLQLKVGYNPAVLTPVAEPFVAGAIAPSFSPSVTKSGDDALVVSGALGGLVPEQRGILFTLKFTKAANADLAAANLTVAEFTIESSGHGTKIGLGDTTQGGSGDVNLDGTVDAADLTALKALLGKPSAEIGDQVFRNADLNGDDKLDGKDVTLLGRKIRGK